MAIGDGSGWDETTPTDATTAIQIDDYNRDLRVGVSARMRHEHEWPDSQSATSEGGKHKWVTMQAQSTKPTLAGTQVAAIYIKTDDNLYFEKSAGTEVQIVVGTAVGDGKVLISATDTAAGYLIDAFDTSMIRLVSTTAGSEAIGLRTYDSGWFAVSTTSSYTKTHGLGTTLAIFQMNYADDTAGTNTIRVDLSHCSYDNLVERGSQIQGITVTECTVYTTKYLISKVGVHNPGGGAGYTTGFFRVFGLALG